eukprot:gene12290-biopygen2605
MVTSAIITESPSPTRVPIRHRHRPGSRSATVTGQGPKTGRCSDGVRGIAPTAAAAGGARKGAATAAAAAYPRFAEDQNTAPPGNWELPKLGTHWSCGGGRAQPN